MILWIVEDDDMHLRKLLEKLKEDFPESFRHDAADEKDSPETFRIHVNRDIAWPEGDRLPRLTPDPGVRQPGSADHLPDIVILDLLLESVANESGESPEFAGSSFYRRLRKEEELAHKRPSQVIVYSQFRGLACTENFVQECGAVDHRFDDVPKSPALLLEKLYLAKQKVLDGE